jgi:hypothetical protein
MAQPPHGSEPLPRTFETIRLLVPPPVGLEGIHLLMTSEEVKTILKKARLRINESEGLIEGIQASVINVSQPRKGFQAFSFQFREDKLYSVTIEYDMRYFPTFDFPAYIAELKAKYGEPAAVKEPTKDAPPPLAALKLIEHDWVDHQTELAINYAPPGKQPTVFDRELPAGLVWQIADKPLMEKVRADNAARFKPKREYTEEERQEALKKLLEGARQNQEEIEKQNGR